MIKPFFQGVFKQYDYVHHVYKDDEYLKNKIVYVLDTNNIIRLFLVDTINLTVTKERSISYTNFIYKYINTTLPFNVNKISAINGFNEKNELLTTMFINFDFGSSKQYLIQLNIDDDFNIVGATKIDFLFNTNHIFLYVMNRQIKKYINEQETIIHDHGLLYIETEDGSLSEKYIKKIPIYYNDKEKLALEGIIDNIDTDFPIVDQWIGHPVVMKLPPGTIDMHTDWSTGMGILKFNN